MPLQQGEVQGYDFNRSTAGVHFRDFCPNAFTVSRHIDLVRTGHSSIARCGIKKAALNLSAVFFFFLSAFPVR